VRAITEGRLGRRPCCGRCGASQGVRNGHADGFQHYPCRACGRTFNALTGTALGRLRQRAKWLEQASVPEAGLRVRRAAELGVHRGTEFRWRHRFLGPASAVRATALAGVAEADGTYILRSYKGQGRQAGAFGRAGADPGVARAFWANGGLCPGTRRHRSHCPSRAQQRTG
jgi:transposase-like protein